MLSAGSGFEATAASSGHTGAPESEPHKGSALIHRPPSASEMELTLVCVKCSQKIYWMSILNRMHIKLSKDKSKKYLGKSGKIVNNVIL